MTIPGNPIRLLLILLLLAAAGAVRAGTPVPPHVGVVGAAVADTGDVRFTADTVIVPTVPVDTCILDTLYLVHTSKTSRRISSARFIPEVSEFSLVGNVVGLVLSSALSEASVELRYCPTDVGSDTVRLMIEYGDSASSFRDTVVLVGRGTAGQVNSAPTVRFDSASRLDLSVIDFGHVSRANGRSTWIKLVNVGAVAAVGRILLREIDRGFSIDSLRVADTYVLPDSAAARTIASNDSVQIHLLYLPTGALVDSTRLVFRADGGDRSILLRGNGTGPVLELVDTTRAGVIDADTCVILEFPVRNSGNEPLEIAGVVISDTTHFTQAGETFRQFPVVIPAGESRNFVARFCPGDTGTFSTLVTFATKGVNEARTLLLGSGIRGALVVDAPDPITVASGCDTVRVVVHNVGNVSNTVLPAGLVYGDKGFVLIDGGSPPRRLYAGGTMVIRVLFCPQSYTYSGDTLHIVDGNGRVIGVVLSGRGLGTTLQAERLLSEGTPLSLLDLGSVAVDRTVQTTVYIRNLSGVGVIVPDTGITVRSFRGATGSVFSAGTASGLRTLTIPAGLVDSIRLVYTPHGVVRDSFAVTVSGTLQNETFPVSVAFSVVASATAGSGDVRTIRLGGAAGRVGDTLAMPVIVSRPLVALDGITSLRLVFSYDRRSLYPIRDDARGITLHDSAGTMVAVRSDGAPLVGDTIAYLRFLPLSTSTMLTRVTLVDSVLLNGKPIPRSALVAFDTIAGCNVDSTLAFSSRMSLGGLLLSGGTDATITYRAPSGYSPGLRMIDLDGSVRLATVLPAGTGQEQAVTVPIGPISPGLYLLELRLGDDRRATPVMVVR